jgi:hypothetical protein
MPTPETAARFRFVRRGFELGQHFEVANCDLKNRAQLA